MELSDICPQIYNLFSCSDIIAYQKNTKNNWIYNKLLIAQLQHLHCNIMPIEPSSYPVILKPIYNLFGMSKDVYLLKNIDDYNKHVNHLGFWTEFLSGVHRSIDLVIINNKIIWKTFFIGYKLDVIGAFDYWELCWESLPQKLLENIQLIINKLDNYTGIINMESIDNYIIECHLRPGDVLFLNNKIIKEMIKLYMIGKWELKEYEEEKMFLLPIWKEYIKTEKNIVSILQEHKNLYYEMDTDILPSPPELQRQCLLICNDLNLLFKIRSEVYN